MNILVLTNEYPYEKYPKPDWTWVVAYFCREWVKQGHSVIAINNAASFPGSYYITAGILKRIIASYYDVSEKGLSETGWTKEFCFQDQGVTVINYPMKKYFPGGKYSKNILKKQIGRICSKLSELQFIPDVITGHWLNPQLMLVAELADKYIGAKTGFVFHGDCTIKNCKKFNAKNYIYRIGSIGCRSKTSCQQIQEFFHLKKVFVCASGIPDAFAEQYRLYDKKLFNKNKTRIISVGRLVKYKNIDTVINACNNTLDKKEYTLTIIGDGPLSSELKKLVRRNKQELCVYFTGKLLREEIQTRLRESEIFILISKRETFGLVYLEAMLQGCIVIASKYGGIDGIIEDGINGFLCEEGNTEELETVLVKVTHLPGDVKKKISRNAIATAKEYTDSKTAKRYLSEIIT